MVLLILFICSNNLNSQVIFNKGTSISISSGIYVSSKDVENTSSGLLKNNGILTLSGNYINSATTAGNGFYNLKGNWDDSGIFNHDNSTVTFNGTGNQLIQRSTGETFFRLKIDYPTAVLTQISNPGKDLNIVNNLDILNGTLSLGFTTTNVNIGGHAQINGNLIYNDISEQVISISDTLKGSGKIDMSLSTLSHILYLAGAANSISTFSTNPGSASIVNYNGTVPYQTVFPSANYRNLIISNSGVKILQGNSIVGLNLTITNGAIFDLGSTATTLGILGNSSVAGSMRFSGSSVKNVTLNGNLSGSGSIDMSGGNLSHLLNLYGQSNVIGSYSSGLNSTVKYALNDIQYIFTSDDYRHLTISGTGTKTMNADITAKGVLTMSAGNINANGFILKLSNPDPLAIIRTNGRVIGKLQRAIGYTASEYFYPIGSAASYNPLKMAFLDLTQGPLTAQFIQSDIGSTAGLPLDDNGNEIYEVYPDGYWSLTSSGMSSGNYSVKLDFNGFGGIDKSASIIRRTNGGNFDVTGVHDTITLTEISRKQMNGISTVTTDLVIGRGRPRITQQPDNIDVCEGSDAYFQVKARGRWSLSYQWQENTGSGFSNVVNGGPYSGATTNRLNIDAAPFSMNGYRYRCIITDSQGHSNTTIEVLLTVNKIPVATATPGSQPVCPGMPFTINLGTSNGVAGTTFMWKRTNPNGISTGLLRTGSATGGQINGSINNTTDAPITVTFRIVPTGPGTTYCVGDSITATVTINPTPKVLASPQNPEQCDSTTTNIRLTSPSIFTSGVVHFKYTVSTTGTVNGYTTPLGGLSNEHHITDNLINLTDHWQVVTYTVVPESGAGCIDGTPVNVNVTVNPTPRVVPVNVRPAICTGGSTEIQLTTPTVMTTGSIRFDYTVALTGTLGDLTGNTTEGNNKYPGSTITFPYVNHDDEIQSVLYYIKPYNNQICLPGPVYTSEVEVHAEPVQSIVEIEPLTCSSGSGLATLGLDLADGGAPFGIYWQGPVGYTAHDSVEIHNASSGRYIATVTDNLGCIADDTLTISPITPAPVISAMIIPPGLYNISCVNSTDGVILVSAKDGITPPYRFWIYKNSTIPIDSGVFENNFSSDPDTYKYIYNLGAGTYTNIVRDINDCESRTSFTLRVPPALRTTFGKSTFDGGFNVSCKGYSNGSAWVTVTGGRTGAYTYHWYTTTGTIPGADNTNRIDNITAGKYYVEVWDVLGCSKLDSVVITEPDGMILTGYQRSESPDHNFNISCHGGNDGSIKLSLSGGSGNYIFSWTGPGGFTATTKDISGLRAGPYTCLVTDVNGCTLTTPVIVLTEPDALSSVVTKSTFNGGYNINCHGGSGSVNMVISGGSTGNYTYQWTTADGSGIMPGQADQPSLTAGTYHVIVDDINGCSLPVDITVTEPPAFSINLAATHITCQTPGFSNGSIDLSVTGGAAPYEYLWSNGLTTQDISGLTEGDYKVIVTYNNTCSLNDSIRINLPPPLTYNKSVSAFNGFNVSCYGQSDGFITVEPTGGKEPFIYSWTGPGGFIASTKAISGLKAGEYHLMITDGNYCTASESITLTEPGRLDLSFNLSSSTSGGFNINCAGKNTGSIDVVPVNSVGTVQYLWSDGGNGASRENLTAGEYSVIITDANNCQVSSSVTLTQPDTMKLIFAVKPPFCPDMPDGEIKTSVTGGVTGTDYKYKWSDNSTGSDITNITMGLYSVRVEDLNGCILKDSVFVEPQNKICLIIPNIISPNGDLINDEWNIGNIDLYPQMEIRIFTRSGQTIWRSEKGYPKPWNGRSNGTDMPIDSYHYIIDLHNGSKPIIGNVTIVK